MTEARMKTSVSLSDVDLSKLIDSVDPEVRAAAEQAGRRLTAPSRWPSIAPHVAALVADIISEAKKEGRLIFRGTAVSHCRYCAARSTWVRPKRKRHDVESKISGVEMADRFVVVTGHISVGGCRACVDAALPVLQAELATFPVELPPPLRTEGAPVYRRWDRCRCKRCDWTGHDGQLGKMPALMGGEYPGRCPACGAERRFLGPDPFGRLDGFDVVEEKSS